MANNDAVAEITISAVLKRLFRFKLPIALLFAALSYAGMYYVKKLPEKYTAVTKIIYQPSQQSMQSGMNALAALAGLSMENNANDISSYIPEVVFTRDVLGQIASHKWKTSLLNTDSNAEKILYEWWKLDSLNPKLLSAEDKQLIVIQKLQSKKNPYITFETDKVSGLVNLTTTFEDPRLAYDINNYLYEILNDYVKNKLKIKAAKTTEFIQERLVEAKANLHSAESRLYAYRASNLVRESPNTMLEENRLQMDLSAKQEIYLSFLKQFELSRIDELKERPVLEIFETPLMPKKPSKPSKLVLSSLAVAFSFTASVCLFLAWSLVWDYRKHLWNLVFGK